MGVAQTTYSQEGEIDCIFSPIANGDSRHGETFYPSSLNCGPIGSLRISDAKRSITPGWKFDIFMVLLSCYQNHLMEVISPQESPPSDSTGGSSPYSLPQFLFSVRMGGWLEAI